MTEAWIRSDNIPLEVLSSALVFLLRIQFVPLEREEIRIKKTRTMEV